MLDGKMKTKIKNLQLCNFGGNIGRQKIKQNKHGSREWLSTLQDFVPFPNSHAVPCGQISMHELVLSEIFHSFSNFHANLQQGAHSQLEKQNKNKQKTMRNPEVSSLSINNMWTCDVDWKLWLESFESGEKQEEFDEQVALKVCCWLINSVLPTKNLSCQPSEFLSSREQQTSCSTLAQNNYQVVLCRQMMKINDLFPDIHVLSRPFTRFYW